MNLDQLVNNWGGFEELVQDMHSSGDVKVERDVTLTGASGATRQIDVLITHTKGPYKYLTLVECKYWSKKVERANIDVLYAGMLDLNASKGVFFTTVGYQEGAEIYAKSKGIDIFIVRDLSDEEWGLPGKIIDLYLQIISKSIYKLNFVNLQCVSFRPDDLNNKLHINIDFNNKNTNFIISSHKNKHKTLEDILDAASNFAIKEIQKKPFIINNGDECTRYFSVDVNIPFETNPLQITHGNIILIIPRIEFVTGLKFQQSHIINDRSKNYLYALAVQDCVNRNTFIVSKVNTESNPTWDGIEIHESSDAANALKNGSIIQVVLNGVFDPKEMDGLKEIKAEI